MSAFISVNNLSFSIIPCRWFDKGWEVTFEAWNGGFSIEFLTSAFMLSVEIKWFTMSQGESANITFQFYV